MDIICNNITKFFEEIFEDLECQPDTKAYITSIYSKYKCSEFDFSKDSITLLFAQARSKHNFLMYQNIGDWIFYINTTNPNYLKDASKDYYDTIARLSYNSCYKLINRQWKLFEELSDNYNKLEHDVKKQLINKKLYGMKIF